MKKILNTKIGINSITYTVLDDNDEIVTERISSSLNRDLRDNLAKGNVRNVSKIINDWAKRSSYLDRDDILNVVYRLYLNMNLEEDVEEIEEYFNNEM